jgi:hypothetical protein
MSAGDSKSDAKTADSSALALAFTSDLLPVEKTALGDKIKAFERAAETNLSDKLPWVARLDGHGFSKFTRGFTKPCDPRITVRCCAVVLCS